jgi:hypothetical protein
MKKMLGLLLVLAMVAAACGDDDDAGSADNCEGVADAAIDLLQETIDALGDLSAEELASLDSEEPPEAFADLEAEGEALEARATELGCSDEEMGRFVADRIDDLDVAADNIIGQFILEGLRSGEGDFGDLFGE